MEEQLAIVQRIFRAAVDKEGSAARVAHYLGLSCRDLGTYFRGEAMPPDYVLLRAVHLILEELPSIRATSSQDAWRSLALPRE
jgi:hypothetical protein